MQDLIMNNKLQLPSALLKKFVREWIKLQPLEDENKRVLVMQRHHFSLKWIEDIPAYFSVLIVWQQWNKKLENEMNICARNI